MGDVWVVGRDGEVQRAPCGVAFGELWGNLASSDPCLHGPECLSLSYQLDSLKVLPAKLWHHWWGFSVFCSWICTWISQCGPFQKYLGRKLLALMGSQENGDVFGSVLESTHSGLFERHFPQSSLHQWWGSQENGDVFGCTERASLKDDLTRELWMDGQSTSYSGTQGEQIESVEF